MERYICIHGHVYQPPRENPWLEAIEIQDSAYPFTTGTKESHLNVMHRILLPETLMVMGKYWI